MHRDARGSRAHPKLVEVELVHLVDRAVWDHDGGRVVAVQRGAAHHATDNPLGWATGHDLGRRFKAGRYG